MRTTVSIDDDVLTVAKALSQARGESLGKVLSELARRGLRPVAQYADRDDFPVFEVREDSAVFGPIEVATALDED